MELEIGGTYEIIADGGKGAKYVVRIKEDKSDRYELTILEFNGDKYNISGHVFKTGLLLQKGKITRLDKPLSKIEELVELQAAYGDIKPKKRRTSEEIEVDNLIEYVQLTIKFNETWELVNAALDNDNYDVFMELSKEYAKVKKQRQNLRKKVRA